MVLKFKMTFVGLPPQLKGRVPASIIQQEAIKFIDKSLVIIRGKMVEVSPFGGTSTLKNSWIIKPTKKLGKSTVGSVGSQVVQALVLEDGARPHHPPPGALDVWVRRTFGITKQSRVSAVSFAISRKISKKGLPLVKSKKGMFSRGLREIIPLIGSIHRDMIDRIVKAFK